MMEEESRIILFLRKNWSKCLLSFLTIACVIAWSERFLNSNKDQSNQDFLLISQLFEKFQKGENFSSESIESAENILDRHPELHPKYDIMLALILASQAKTDNSMKYLQSIVDRADPDLPVFFKEYSYTTLLISEKKFEEALKRSCTLEETLKGDTDYQTLEAMNLLRLVFLADRLEQKEIKNIFWKKLINHPAYPPIESVLREGKLSLADYMKSV